jgi:hypothetical protein
MKSVHNSGGVYIECRDIDWSKDEMEITGIISGQIN